MKVGLIGVNGYGREYLKQLLRLHHNGRIQLVAAVVFEPDHSEGQLAQLEMVGAAVYSHPEELFDLHLDLCCIPTPPQTHAELAVSALQAGFNVLVEKPLCSSSTEAEAILAAQEKSGKAVIVGYQDFARQETRLLQRVIETGLIGEIKEVCCAGIWPRDSAYYRRNSWAGKIQIGQRKILDNPAHNAFAHYLNLAILWSGFDLNFIESADVRAQLLRANGVESADTVCMQMSSGERRFTALYSHAGHDSLEPRIRIEGSKGKLDWELQQYSIAGSSRKTYGSAGEALQGSRESFFDLIARPSSWPILCSAREAAPEVRMIEQLFDTGTVLEIDKSWVDGSDQMASVRGISETFSRCFNEGCLPVDLGIDWTRPAR